jgi:acyl-CoA synthetase (NDP forming)
MKSQVQSLTGIVPQKFLIQEMVTDGVELVLGMRRDPLGIGILLGMGGVASQLYMDTALRLLPFSGGLSKKDALAMAQELKTWPLLDGFRGAPKADVDALVDAIVSFSEMSAQLGDRLVEAEINPIFVLEQGKGVKAADAIAVISQ